MGLGDFLFKKDDVPQKKTSQPSAPLQGAYIPPTTSTLTGGSSNDYNKHLNELMDKSNMPGPDYYEFSKALEGLLTMPLTDVQKYQIAFNTFNAQGVTANQLITSGEKYITVLQKYSADFHNQLANDSTSGVTEKRKSVEVLQKEIVDLQSEIQKKSELINKYTMEASTNEGKLAMEESSFTIALNNKIATINNHISQIKTILNVTN